MSDKKSKSDTVDKVTAESVVKKPNEKISANKKNAADNVIKSKAGSHSDDLKARAAKAKKRAQEKILEKSYVSDPPADPLERLADTFDNSARRWEMVVYPSLFAFVLLAGYGFFLIYRLTHDISILSQSVTRMAVIVSDAMPRMAKDINGMTGSMDHMSGDIGGMTTEISSMSGQMNSLTPMSKNIHSMTQNMGSMNRSVYGMQRDMHGMNRTVSSGPFGMMNDMLPFSSNSNVPPPMSPPGNWPSYNPATRPPVVAKPFSKKQALKLSPNNPPKNNLPTGNSSTKKQLPPVAIKPQAVKLISPKVSSNRGGVKKQEMKMPEVSPVILPTTVIK